MKLTQFGTVGTFVLMDENAKALIDQVAREIEIRTETNFVEQFRVQLISAVEMLLQKDFPRLIQILYRLDVDEEKLKTQLKSSAGNGVAELIANLIIERQLQKLEMRERYRGSDPISGEDKW